MYFTSENILLISSILIFCSILISKVGYRFGLPSLLLFLIAGMLFGTDGLGLQFNDMKHAQFVGMVALCIILFTGGLETKVKEIRPVMGEGLVLSTLGVVLMTLFTGGFILLLSEMEMVPMSLPVVTCFLLAATMSSTDSASVFNILRNSRMKLKNNIQPLLELESGSNDPMAYILTIVLIQVAGSLSGNSTENINLWGILGDASVVLLLQFSVGIISGIVMGYFSIWVLNKVHLNNTPLYAIMLLSIVFFTFTVTTKLQGNGYLAVYLAGVIIGNHKISCRKEIFSFLDGMTWLVQIVMFVALGLLVNPHEMMKTAPFALMIGIFMIIIARPLSVWLSLIPFRKINGKSKTFISWVGLRGAVPIIFATYPVISDVEGSDIIFNIVFFITLLSLVIQGSSITGIARKLHLDLPDTGDDNKFGIEVPEEAGKLMEITLTEESVKLGDTLKEVRLPAGMLVMMVKRGSKFIVPNGSMKLYAGDRLLIISSTDDEI